MSFLIPSVQKSENKQSKHNEEAHSTSCLGLCMILFCHNGFALFNIYDFPYIEYIETVADILLLISVNV